MRTKKSVKHAFTNYWIKDDGKDENDKDKGSRYDFWFLRFNKYIFLI